MQAEELFTAREISGALNNAVIYTGRPVEGVILEERKRRLREYSQAVIEPTVEHAAEGLLTYPELVHVFAAAALYLQLHYVSGTEKVPAAPAAKVIYE